eukprot:gene677-2108_t
MSADHAATSGVAVDAVVDAPLSKLHLLLGEMVMGRRSHCYSKNYPGAKQVRHLEPVLPRLHLLLEEMAAGRRLR